ncbi:MULTISPECIES: siderophore ABC transporter substrate-binding protein [Rhodococcus]|uniref:Iron ABC transporter substrate-binding protein n=1 Tax=Rhodococcus pyridinivorans SB3094 TaxID=1435356 RepID=V9XD77_9NOCA|nr:MULTISPECIES: ABC transporter substrate-binding protein [Rhodococcus]AHD21396.1 iron ABC transporter substrate-binding protein [Rhodococcus pyridinivorans SB3094]AYA24180.1 iron ABC transporter substrate-binding protein [Rhodococcus rhodochrous]MBF4478384.1 ABC transporter substrate-binding protein [Rhodococcus rhodochrous]MCT7291112.1 ABC transporter substrate-binding protein [Rhodococcus sp. PAE-6]MDC3724115.1 ABC transporter substrate-binding protein [Rhodococcus sp. Rp3]
MNASRLYRGAVLGTLAALALTACSSDPATESSDTAAATVTVEDNFGTQTVTVPPKSVVATDNGTFETLDTWGVPLAAGAVSLMPKTISYTEDDSIVDLGSHREPNLEAVVAVEPDLIINGGRYAQFREQFEELAPDATIVEVAPRDGEDFAEELKRGTTVLGEIFAKEAEAQELNDALDASIARVQAAYSPDQSVMGLIVSGGEIGYVAPSTGRTIGPMFDIFGLTPALEVPEGTDNHQGDDISVEAIAASNPGLIIVMDRDAGTSTGGGPDYVPATTVINDSQALQNVKAVQEGNIIYLPADTYTNESIQTYTEFFNSLADLLEKNAQTAENK